MEDTNITQMDPEYHGVIEVVAQRYRGYYGPILGISFRCEHCGEVAPLGELRDHILTHVVWRSTGAQ